LKHKALVFISGLLFSLLPASAQLAVDPGYFPSDLKQYLNLTDAEVTFIQQASTDYSQLAASKQLRIFELQNEIAAETQKDQPDPMALGVRYAEIESIRRDLTNQLAALRDKLRASLDDTQRSKLTALNDARILQPIVTDAQCENLLDPGIPVFRSGQFSGVLVGDFSLSSSSTVSGCYLSLFPQELSQYLNVSSDQADSITSLNTNNQQQTAGRQQNISDLQMQIAQESAKDTLDPLALGTLYAQVEDIRRSIANDLTALRNNARAVLSDMQRVKLNSLDDARKLQPLISEATCENLLDPQATQWFNTPTVISGAFSSGGGFTSVFSCVSGIPAPSVVIPFPANP
jgi:hypothetical protein